MSSRDAKFELLNGFYSKFTELSSRFSQLFDSQYQACDIRGESKPVKALYSFIMQNISTSGSNYQSIDTLLLRILLQSLHATLDQGPTTASVDDAKLQILAATVATFEALPTHVGDISNSFSVDGAGSSSGGGGHGKSTAMKCENDSFRAKKMYLMTSFSQLQTVLTLTEGLDSILQTPYIQAPLPQPPSTQISSDVATTSSSTAVPPRNMLVWLAQLHQYLQPSVAVIGAAIRSAIFFTSLGTR